MRKKASTSPSADNTSDQQHCLRSHSHDRHSSGGGGIDLLVCFSSRSSMRATSSSKSLLSPGRSATSGQPAPSLSTSLSRRLRNSGSVKGAQSPMFPAGSGGTGRRIGAAFETAEPSSPKVTCIGQVRVKGGKRKGAKIPPKGAALRSKSKRTGSEASFRLAAEENRGQGGWVYQIPISICEALKAFGSCGGKSMCSSKSKRRRSRSGGTGVGDGSCGSAFARWLVAATDEKAAAAVVDDEEVAEMRIGRGGEVGLVLGKWEERVEVVEIVEERIKDEILEEKSEKEREEPRVSICIPPKNALLLMRCRSDPVRMAALATRFFGSPAAAVAAAATAAEVKVHDKEEVEYQDEEEELEEEGGSKEEPDNDVGDKLDTAEAFFDMAEMDLNNSEVEVVDEDTFLEGEEEQVGDIVLKDTVLENKGEELCPEQSASCPKCSVSDEKETENEEGQGKQLFERVTAESKMKVKEDVIKGRKSGSKHRGFSLREKEGRRHSFSAEGEARRTSFLGFKEARRASISLDRDGRRWSFSVESGELVIEPKNLKDLRKGNKISPEPEQAKEDAGSIEEPVTEEPIIVAERGQCGEILYNAQGNLQELHQLEFEENDEEEELKDGDSDVEEEAQQKGGELPDCLLLMMYEPKLSMEVSRETWVCSNDFINWCSHPTTNRQYAEARGGRTATSSSRANIKAKRKAKIIVDGNRDAKIKACSNNNNIVVTNVIADQPPPPPASSVASTLGQEVKLDFPVNRTLYEPVYEPFILKRCKSEPMRSSAKLAPDACFWKDRHRPIGAVGF